MQTKRKRPLTKKIAEDLESGILRGEYQPGGLLPSIRELAAFYHASISSAVGAYRILERKKLVEKEHGRGIFVSEIQNRSHKKNTLQIAAYTYRGHKLAGTIQRFLPHQVSCYGLPAYQNYTEYVDFVRKNMRQIPGLVMLDEGILPSMVENGVLLPLDDLLHQAGAEHLLEKIHPTILRSLRINGILYAVPMSVQPTMVFLNAGVFREAGVNLPDSSWTWDTFFSCQDQLTVAKNNSVERFGLGLMCDFNGAMPLIRRFGGELFDPNGNCIIASEAFQRGLRDFLHVFNHPGCRIHRNNEERDHLGRMMAAGKIAMLLGNEYDAAPARAGLSGNDFLELPLPEWNSGMRGTLSVYGIGITRGSLRQEALLKTLLTVADSAVRNTSARLSHRRPVRICDLRYEEICALNHASPVLQHRSAYAAKYIMTQLAGRIFHGDELSSFELCEIESSIMKNIMEHEKQQPDVR